MGKLNTNLTRTKRQVQLDVSTSWRNAVSCLRCMPVSSHQNSPGEVLRSHSSFVGMNSLLT